MVSVFFFEWCLHYSLFNSHDLPEVVTSWGSDFKNMADVNDDDTDSGQ